MNGFSTGKAVRYAVLPGIWPRLRGLFFSGFGTLAYFIALTYAMVRLLPANHPYLNPENIGKYGIRHVIAAAMHDLKFTWRNLDQIIIFFALLAGTTALLVYVAGTLMFLVVSPVAASWFTHPSPVTDISYIMLDRIFGVAGIFNSDVTTNVAVWGPFPSPFNVGLQALFQFYSMALFLLSVLIFAYFIITVVAETALTGTPFGKRFDNLWIPIRIIVALGLLMPFLGGLNCAQYIVLYSARMGASIATNAWIVYNLHAGDTPIGLVNKDTVVKPVTPDYSKLIKELIVIRGCLEMSLQNDPTGFGATEFMVAESTAQPLLDFPATFWPTVPSRSPLSSVMVSGVPFKPQYKNLATFKPALLFYGGKNIRLVFGYHDPDRFKEFPGAVFPACGEIVIPVTGVSGEALYTAEAYMATVIRILYSIPRMTAPATTLDAYEEALVHASAKPYYDSSPGWRITAKDTFPSIPNVDCTWDSDSDNISEAPRGGGGMPHPVLGDCREQAAPIYWVTLIKRYQEAFKWAPLAGYDFLTENVFGEDLNFSIGDTAFSTAAGTFTLDSTAFSTVGTANPIHMHFDTLRLGWGGAGLWYNRIAEKNGSLLAAVNAAPYLVKYPYVMEKVKEQRLKSDSKVDQSKCESYNPAKAGVTAIDLPDAKNQYGIESATALYNLCDELFRNEIVKPADTRSVMQPNMIKNIMNTLFGADTFFNVLDNKTVHPMAMLSNLGRTLIDKAIFNLMAATGTSVVAGLNQAFLGKDDPGFAHITIAASQISRALTAFGGIALAAGILLYYVLPLLPFMYFFFAVGRWVKTIFEAMVGVPLWALAHLSMKGPGLPSTAASSGYFLILEIAIRPIITVYCLVGSFAIFAALVVVLNTIFTLATSNIFGVDVAALKTYDDVGIPGPDTRLPDMRGIVDQFFMTMLYIMLVYMTGTSCFKLIDIIPDNILRWSGAGVRSWGASDNADDLVDRTGQMVAGGAYMRWNIVAGEVNRIGGLAAGEAQQVIAAHAAKQKPPGGGSGAGGAGSGAGSGAGGAGAGAGGGAGGAGAGAGAGAGGAGAGAGAGAGGAGAGTGAAGGGGTGGRPDVVPAGGITPAGARPRGQGGSVAEPPTPPPRGPKTDG